MSEDENLHQEYTYGSDKEVTSTLTSPVGSSLCMQTFASSVVDDVNHTKTVTNTDTAGNVTQTVTNTLNDLTVSSTDGNGVKTEFTYDELKNLKSLLTNGSNAKTEFTYEHGNIKTITVNSEGTDKTVYTFDYDGFGDLLSIKIGSKTLVIYNYENKLHTPLTIQYANGTIITSTYDGKGRVLTQKCGSTLDVVYDYDEQGNVYKTVDDVVYTLTKTIDGVVQVYDTVRDIYFQKYQKTENGLEETVNGKDYSTKYSTAAKTANSAACSTVEFGNAKQETYTDDFGRISQIITTLDDVEVMKQVYSYSEDTKDGKTYTDDLVESITTNYGSTSTVEKYYYDGNGNIIRKIKDGVIAQAYTYDSLNQLTEEYDYTTSITTCYTYDDLGNVLRAKKRRFTFNGYNGFDYEDISTDQYGYDADWHEQLTSFNGTDIAYDASGNPTTLNGYNLTWQNGRQLKCAQKGSVNYNFKYDANGIRTSKNCSDALNYTASSHTYSTVDGLITADRVQGGGMNVQSYDYTVYYVYDSNSQPIGFKYNNKFYTYVKNIQGDILAVVDDEGSKVAEYEYDSWGKVTKATGDMASINSLLYRGYYYDSEFGLYYLQSRYYNPQTRRFINADEPTLISLLTQSSVLGGNLYAYCGNNAVNKLDPSGHFAISWSKLAYILDLGLFLTSFSPWGLAARIVIISVYMIRIGVAVVLLRKNNRKYKKGTKKWAFSVFDAAYNILVSIMGIGATILGLPRIKIRVNTLTTTIKAICTVFGISLSCAGLLMSWANSLSSKKLSFRR